MEKVVLGFYALYLAFAAGVRMLLQRARTGSSGYAGVHAKVGTIEWLASAVFAGSYALGVASPVLAMTGVDRPVGVLDVGVAHATGVSLFAVGFALTLWAQASMGASWRIGVAPGDSTALVHGGPFGVVRNPIFAAMLLAQAGLVLCLPNVSAIAAATGLLLGVELQVRVVEEPHLLRAHGEPYASYRRRVGRFVPRLRPSRCPR